jgi:hypothetical protein
MLDNFQCALAYRYLNLLYRLESSGYLKKEALTILLKPRKWLLPCKGKEEQELVNIKNLHPLTAKKLILRLEEDINKLEKAEAELLVVADEVTKMLDLNTYTSIYFASKKWETFWVSHRDIVPLLVTQRPVILKVAQHLIVKRAEIFKGE